jgi:hypothetical protein
LYKWLDLLRITYHVCKECLDIDKNYVMTQTEIAQVFILLLIFISKKTVIAAVRIFLFLYLLMKYCFRYNYVDFSYDGGVCIALFSKQDYYKLPIM